MRLTFGSVFAALAIVPVLGIQITFPSATESWVQDEQNIITWTFEDGDPTSFSIDVENQNKTLLNGVFTIAMDVNTSAGFFLVQNVTLQVGSGYLINFVDESDNDIIFAQSGPFSILPP